MSELLKLILILGSGILIIGIGLFVQLKNKKSNQFNPNYSSDIGFNPDEEKAKQYIETYKSQYPRDSIKIGLKNMGISDIESETFLQKYFD